MNPWMYILVGGLMVAIGGIFATHGWNQIKKQEDLTSLSVSPSIDVDVQIDKIIFRNTGTQPITDVKVSYAVYKIERGSQKILSRDILGQRIQLSKELRKDDSIMIDPSTIAFLDKIETTDEKLNANIFWVAIFEYYRKIDNKRYIHVEPFMPAYIENHWTLFSVYVNGKTYGGGDPLFFVNLTQEIEKIEMRLFKAAN